MVRKRRSDKKDTICKRCGHECSTPQKLREHLKRKNLCKSLQNQRDITFSIQEPVQKPISSKIPNKGSQEVIAKIYKESDQIPETDEPLVKANIQKLSLRNQPVCTRLTINKRSEESLKEWATRLADRIDKLTSVK
jgi:multidrug efflux pump subunit AcrB